MKNAGILARAGYSIAGLRAAWREERSFRDHVALSMLLLAGMAVLRPDAWWWAVIVLALACGWAFEAMNAALEALCDRLHPARDPAIGRAKDMASAAAFVVNCAAAGLAIAMVVSTVA
ncbi:Diacylglycerol kinase [Tsuneonella dongtanensis]|uniref:Diacylglycerol kinase n=1 Tax=Tsuneonella dongtanensis TaxID=692370 RepID=A0A1B2AD63_9SPHN|nr:diacylglycerol kinase [Tsuneonella dongtanensis]ANY19995.1 Diacylglycerol kinase [Tsuneonella dongtanensis]